MTDIGGRLILICGLPDSGKTTLSLDLARRLGASRYCPDEWMEALALDLYDEKRRARIEALQWEAARTVLVLGGTAIIEWGTWARSERDSLRLEARALGASAELIYLDAPAEVLFERIRRRDAEVPPITRDTVQGWMETFEAPTPDEFALYDQSAGH